MPEPVNGRLEQIIQLQKQADELYNSIEESHPEVWKILQMVDAARQHAEQEKQKIRDELIAAKDFSVKQVAGFNISVSRTVKLAVADQTKVNPDFKRTEEVVDLKKAQEYMKVMGELPAGFEDKSVYRLNWKEIKNA